MMSLKIQLFADAHRGIFCDKMANVILRWCGFFLIFIASCSSSQVVINGQKINTVIADEPSEWQEGLQGVASMSADSGMLFIFPNPQEVKFWMKNTMIPLDMIFIDENKVIQFIRKSVQPCSSDPCQTYSHNNIKYVLEVNGGYADKKGIKTGDKVII